MSDVKVEPLGRRRGHKERKLRSIGQMIFTKWSGLAPASLDGGSVVSYLADVGLQLAAPTTPTNYPFHGTHQPVSLTVNLSGFTVPPGGSITVELLNNGNQVPGFEVTYGPGQTGILFFEDDAAKQVTDGVFDIRVTTSGLGVASVPLSATVQGIVVISAIGLLASLFRTLISQGG